MNRFALGIVAGSLIGFLWRRLGGRALTERRAAAGERIRSATAAGQERLRDVRGAKELESLTKDELYARAQAAGIAGRSEMSKEELIEALRGRGSGT